MLPWTWGPLGGPRSVPHAAWRRDRVRNSCPYKVLEESTSSKWQRPLLCHPLGSQSGYFHVAGAGRRDSGVNFGIGIAEIAVGPVGRIDDHQTAAGEPDPGIVRVNR